MKFIQFLTLTLLMLTSKISFSSEGDTLRCDTLMHTTGIDIEFKAGTIVRYNSQGQVIRGTPAHDTDLWTTGPLVCFSPDADIKLNSKGRVTQGILAVNTLALCADNTFKEFQRGTRIFFWDDGLVYGGTLHDVIEIEISGQIVYTSDNSPIEFYPNGKIKLFTSDWNIKIETADGQRVIIAAGKQVKLNDKGSIVQGYLAKKLNYKRKIYPQGSMIKFDDNGNIIETEN